MGLRDSHSGCLGNQWEGTLGSADYLRPYFRIPGLWDCQDLAEHQVKRSSFNPRISRPKQIEELYLKLPETSRKAIEDRDKPTTKTS
jgi:hypothetical protein